MRIKKWSCERAFYEKIVHIPSAISSILQCENFKILSGILEDCSAQIDKIKSAELFQFASCFPEREFAVLSVFWEVRKVTAEIAQFLKENNFEAARNLRNVTIEVCKKWKRFGEMILEKERLDLQN